MYGGGGGGGLLGRSVVLEARQQLHLTRAAINTNFVLSPLDGLRHQFWFLHVF